MRWFAAGVFAVVLAGCGGASEPGAEPRTREALSSDVRTAVTLAGMRPHLRALQRIADGNGGNRAAGGPGYRASVEYVRSRLAAAGYRVRLSPFPYVRFVEQVERARRLGPPARPFPVEALEYSGSTPRAGLRLRAVRSGDGCERSDFPNAARGQIALIQRGVCFFAIKARNAVAAGARAAIVVNNEAGPLDATLVSPVSIPVVAVTRDVGPTLVGARVELVVRARTTRTNVQNVIADAPGAPASPVLIAGGHLDSVTAGAGINDNASGVAALVEIAKALIRLEPRHHVRFAFWGAEESGLHGSRAYVSTLANRGGVAGYLNFDMLGSKRYVRGVYRGPFQQVFTRYFDARDLEHDVIDIAGRSDHAPFEERGIPTGGLYSGGDPCYHQRCDRIPNVNERALDELADAAAHAIVQLEPR
jgi:Zn-dependent M28 family amino/carboxypeptidase